MQLLAEHGRNRLKVWGGFTLPAEQVELMRLAAPRFGRSTVINRATGGSSVDPSRTSRTASFGIDETPLIADLTTRAAQLMDVPRENVEPLQAVQYGPGEEYRPHYDTFDAKDQGSLLALRQGGQRVRTLLAYLDTPDGGGATRFPDHGFMSHAVAGNAVQFDCDPICLHGGDPVSAGIKTAINFWARERRWNTSPQPTVVDGFLSAGECYLLRAIYDSRAETREGGVDRVVRCQPTDPAIATFVAKLGRKMAELFPEPMAIETVVLARLPAGVEMHNHADNVRWNGTVFEPNHTPNRTHTGVCMLTGGHGGSTHYGENPIAPYSFDVDQVEGRLHAHRCGPEFHHRVSASSEPRYAFVGWFKKP